MYALLLVYLPVRSANNVNLVDAGACDASLRTREWSTTRCAKRQTSIGDVQRVSLLGWSAGRELVHACHFIVCQGLPILTLSSPLFPTRCRFVCFAINQARSFDEATSLFDEMVATGNKPDVIHYNVVLRSTHYKNIEGIFEQMQKAECVPDRYTHSILMIGKYWHSSILR